MDASPKVCIIMADITEDYRDDYVIGMEKQANRFGYHTHIFSMPLLDEIHTKREEEIYQLIDFDQYAGVIFFENSFAAHKSLGNMVENLIHKNCRKPVIVLGDSLIFSETYQPNNQAGTEALTDHMIEKHGCELLYFLGGEPGSPMANDAGFMASLKKHGIPCTADNLIYGGYWLECGEALAKDIAYNIVEKPDCVICQDDTVAFFFIKALTKYGIRVPEDIMVTGFGARKDSRNNILSITTYPSNAEYDGRKIMAQLHALIQSCEVTEISLPKSNIITGMSCGCGDRKPADIRLQLERHEARRMNEIYYRNSELEEKLCGCRNYKELHPVIFHSSYLIQDKSFLSINIKESDSASRCIYLRNHAWDDEPLLFNSHDIYPRHLLGSEPRNLHILPMTFQSRFIGHVAVGYDEACVYNTILKQYISRLAIAVSLIQNRLSIETTMQQQIDLQSRIDSLNNKNVQQNNDIIFAEKEHSLHKVPLENVLLFESEGRKTMVVLKNGRFEVKKTLNQLEELYSHKNFMRVSKSALVNLLKVTSITPDTDRTLLATLTGKVTVRVSRKNTTEFKERINIK